MASLINQIIGTGKSVAQSISSNITPPQPIRANSLIGQIDTDAQATTQYLTNATFKHTQDWRIRLSLPSAFQYSELLAPLKQTNGFLFPSTPNIILSSSAAYNQLEPIHNNYQFLSYQNSKTSEIAIECDFYNETPGDARYWVAATHYLRSVTKMFYGDNPADAGSPPPVVKLNGYGDFVFNNVPVVVKTFSVSLPKEVDYISTGITSSAGGNPPAASNGTSWAPTKSNISVTLIPAYSRERVRNFSLTDFVNGKYISDQEGFI